jgi:hypothetical protein
MTTSTSTFQLDGAFGQTGELGAHASVTPRLVIPTTATYCASCGSGLHLVAYDSEGWVCFCRECLDDLDSPSEWTDLGVCD